MKNNSNKKKTKSPHKKKTKKNPDEKKLTRTISSWNSLNNIQNQILKFMSWESKNIYNTTIFHMQIYLTYSDQIFKLIYKLVRKKDITYIADFDRKVYELYDDFYNRYLSIKSFKHHNNIVIYKFIKEQIKDINLVNDNYPIFEKFIINKLVDSNLLKFPNNIDIETKRELFYDIVSSILKSIYNKNFNKTKEEIMSRTKCTINNSRFINQVKKNEHLFKNESKNTYKKLLKNHKCFKDLPKKEGIKSDKNYISRIVYKYYTNPKIPSDLMCNIIVKAHQAYSSFFALRKKGIKTNIPKFLPKDGTCTLLFFPRSRKEETINGKKYYRLTVGKHVSDNFIDIIDDNRYICINEKGIHKLYVQKKYLRFVPKKNKLLKKDNYFYQNKYIPKKSPHIIKGYYIYVGKPKPIEGMRLKLIEISPQYNGYRFKINYIYEANPIDNKPTKGKVASIDLGTVNLLTIYDPNGKQYIIKGNKIINLNHFYNNAIDNAKNLLAMNKPSKKDAKTLYLNDHSAEHDFINGKNPGYVPKRKTKNDKHQKRINQQLDYICSNGNIKMPNEKQLTSKRIRNLLIRRSNKIDDYFKKIVNWFVKKYKDCETIIVGYNKGWKQNVNMEKENNRKFYQIPYVKLLTMLRDKLEKNNQKMAINEESYTSKCDALALEEIRKHDKYKGKRIKRGLFKSSVGIVINADINGAINIMRKWKEKQGEKMTQITEKELCHPRVVKLE